MFSHAFPCAGLPCRPARAIVTVAMCSGLLGASVQAAVAAEQLLSRTAGPFTYVCGGVAADEQATMRTMAPKFDMGMLFTQGARGEYLADVQVTLSRGGKEVASFTADGPRCLLKGPRGTYHLSATYDGKQKRTTIRTGQRNLQLRW